MTNFSLERRARDLDRLTSNEFDLVVVGGGITGAGVALDAATRGLSVGLVEKGDFAAGTSSRSSRLIHGGLRYLRQREFGLVHEALRERHHLSAMAPHLVKPLPFLLPVLDGSPFDDMKTALRAGLWLYDLAGGARGGRFHQRIGRDESLEMSPALSSSKVLDGFIYWDAVNDDARTTLSVIRTAANRYDTAVVNYCEVLEVDPTTRSATSDAGVVLSARDVITGESIEMRARAAMIASGVWSDKIIVGAPRSDCDHRIRPAKGIHVVVARTDFPGDAATLLPVPGEDRFIFTIPWGNYTVIGTTDTDYEGPLDDPSANGDEIDYLLDTVNAWTAEPVKRSSVTSSFAGLRPLASASTDERTADMSRRHVVEAVAPRVGAVYGGKFTTWRSMAAEAIDFAGTDLGLGPLPRSVTADQFIDGASASETSTPRGDSLTLAIGEASAGRIHARYGSHARAIAALCDSPALRAPFAPELDYLKAEAIYAVRHEMAVTLDDLLTRRTRSSTDNLAAARECAPEIAALVAGELGWSSAEQADQVAEYLRATEQFDPLTTE